MNCLTFIRLGYNGPQYSFVSRCKARNSFSCVVDHNHRQWWSGAGVGLSWGGHLPSCRSQ